MFTGGYVAQKLFKVRRSAFLQTYVMCFYMGIIIPQKKRKKQRRRRCDIDVFETPWNHHFQGQKALKTSMST